MNKGQHYLSDKEIAEIKKHNQNGASLRQLANQYGVSHRTIFNYIHGIIQDKKFKKIV